MERSCKRLILRMTLLLSVSLSLAAYAQIQEPTQTFTNEAFTEASQDFLFSDFGAINKHSLETNTLPKKVALTALVLEGRRKGWIGEFSKDYKAVLARFGFYTPSVVMNAPANLKSNWDLPLGLTEKEIRLGLGIRVQGMNVTCAVCHAGRLYDENGAPTSQAWMGLPNTSINLEGYSQAVYQGMRIISNNIPGTYRLMTNIFPEMSLKERVVMQFIIFPKVRDSIRKLEDTWKQPLPFHNGAPGNANGVASLKFQMGLIDKENPKPENGYSAIPALGDRFLRSSLLWDGVYAPVNGTRNAPRSSWTRDDENFLNAVAAIFTIPTMGQSIDGAIENIPRVQKSLSVILNKYESPAFPGPIDMEKARRGFEVFDNSCSRCHGTYEWRGNSVKLTSFPNRMVPQDKMETDPTRWQAVTDDFIKAFNKTNLVTVANVARSEGYTAPILNSLWATAPYLHNGSVPSLWDMMHPESRPKKFQVGGHSLDYTKMGIKLVYNPGADVWEYPADVKPTSAPVVYDTNQPGQSNQGHTRPFANLSEEDKSELLEYLKLL